MKITLIFTGTTQDAWLREGISLYAGRIRHLNGLQITEIPETKALAAMVPARRKEAEAEKIRKLILPGDFVVLLDEHGREMTTTAFSTFLNQRFSAGGKNLIFITGGPYGFSPSLLKEASFLLALSKMTFPHQLVRLLFAEQLYRALTLLHHLPYHHE